MGYYPIQIEAYKKLITFLCNEYDIPLDYPKDEDGNLCTTVDKNAARGRFNGIVNHYNLTRNKIDTAGLNLDNIINELNN